MKLVISGENLYLYQIPLPEKYLAANLPKTDYYYTDTDHCFVVHTKHFNRIQDILKLNGFIQYEVVEVNGLNDLKEIMGIVPGIETKAKVKRDMKPKPKVKEVS